MKRADDGTRNAYEMNGELRAGQKLGLLESAR